MYETDGLPKPWVNHCNGLDEVWVPSQWQKDVFADAGVNDDKMMVHTYIVYMYIHNHSLINV
jgi:hypothetical protein